jgi:N-acetylglucosamine kinase
MPTCSPAKDRPNFKSNASVVLFMILCFDIGGTTIKGAVAFSPDNVMPLPVVQTPADDFEAFAGELQNAVAQTGERPDCVALSITGIIDADTGEAVCANIPCIHGRMLKVDLEARLGLPVLIANDADCFVLAEAALGAGQGHRIVLGAILGSGVGGGLVVDGRLVNADGGFAGEWGHGPAIAAFAGDPPVSIPAYACPCGQTRCVNTIGGARGMERLHQHLHGREFSSEEIVSAWQAGDLDASRTIQVYIDLLSAPLALAVNISGASIVPVGGGLSNAAALIEAIDRAVRSRVLRRFGRPLVVPSLLGIEPGLIGAAILGLGQVRA